MADFTISLSDEKSQLLKEKALKLGLSPKELLRVGVEDLLSKIEADFEETATYILKKNKELYERLS